MAPDTSTLALDPWMGASGDMLLGTLLDLGADRERLAPIESAIDASFAVSTTTVSGIAAVDVSVTTAADADLRHPDEVVAIVEDIGLEPTVEARAVATIDRLAAAEAAVHGVALDEVHFHEVGADDAIADICGVCALLEDLAVEQVVTAPVAAGSGTVDMAHGTYPVPPPAVTELAIDADWTLAAGPVEGELLTPTGAALLAEVASGVTALPPLSVSATGYGAGDRRYDDRPNVLRGVLGTTSGTLPTEDVVVLETIVDDVTPETIGGLQETLTDAGALDVAALPATMKHSRPGHLIQVVVRSVDAAVVARRLAAETGTLGVRERPVRHRFVANRHVETVDLDIAGETVSVDVKVATDEAGERLDVSAEDADARRVAREVDLPVRDIRRRAEAAVYDRD